VSDPPTVTPRRRAALPPWPSPEALAQLVLPPLVLKRDEPLPLSKWAKHFGLCYGQLFHARAIALGLVSHLEQDPEVVKEHDNVGGQAMAAFAARTGLCPTFEIEPCTIWNFRLYQGLTIALNHDLQGRLIYDRGQHQEHEKKGRARPDLWVVLKGQLPFVFFAGWATDAELLAAKLRPMKHGPAYVLDEAELHDRLEIVVPVGVR